MTKETRTAWTVAVVLGILVIILLGVLARGWYEKNHNLGNVLQDNKNALVEQRMQLREACAHEASEPTEECQKALEDLSNLLVDFGQEMRDLQKATTTVIGGQ